MPAANPACKPCARTVGRSVLARGARTFPPDIALLWPLSPSLVGVKKSAVGPDLTWSYTGQMYDGDGVSIGANPPFHAGKGVYGGPAVTNLMTGDSTISRAVTLTAQAYTLMVWSGSASCSYGTATQGSPLKFTATAGSTVFTPAGVSKWMLVAGELPVAPYVPPGVTQPSAAATTGGNGINAAMDRKIQEAFRGKPDGVELNNFAPIDVTTTTAWNPLRSRSGLSLTHRHLVTLRVDTVIGGGVYVYCQKSTPVGSITAPGLYVYESSPTGTDPGFAITPEASNMTVKISSISIQRLTPAVCTVMHEAYMGVGSGDITVDTSLVSCRNVVADVVYVSSGGVLKSSDGVNTATVTVSGGWSAGTVLFPVVRANGTQFQIGYRKAGETAFTWGPLTTFRGTFGPLTNLRACLNNTYPIWARKIATERKFLSEAEIDARSKLVRY